MQVSKDEIIEYLTQIWLNTPRVFYNEHTYDWSGGYKAGIRYAIDLIECYKEEL